VVFLTPRVGQGEPPSAWVDAARHADSLALYMAAGASREIAAALIEAGKPASLPAVLVESASLPEERRLATTLGALAAEALPRAQGPVVMLVGKAFARAIEISATIPHLPLKTASSS
jgi:uroporphyrin-III C-methyltransferase